MLPGFLKIFNEYCKVLEDDDCNLQEQVDDAMEIINHKPSVYEQWADKAGNIKKVLKK